MVYVQTTTTLRHSGLWEVINTLPFSPVWRNPRLWKVKSRQSYTWSFHIDLSCSVSFKMKRCCSKLTFLYCNISLIIINIERNLSLMKQKYKNITEQLSLQNRTTFLQKKTISCILLPWFKRYKVLGASTNTSVFLFQTLFCNNHKNKFFLS